MQNIHSKDWQDQDGENINITIIVFNNKIEVQFSKALFYMKPNFRTLIAMKMTML